jgi:hypothetical protein
MAKKLKVLLDIDVNDKEAIAELERVQRKLKGTGPAARSATGGVSALSQQFNGLKMAMAGLLPALGVGAIVGGIRSIVNEGDRLQKLSLRLGETTENLSALNFVAERSGISAQSMEMALQRMTRRVSEAAAGTGEAKKAIEELGLSAEKLNLLAPKDQLLALADAMEGVTTHNDKVRIAQKLWDSAGVSMLQATADGADGIRELIGVAENLGYTMDTETTAAMAAINDELTNLGARATGTGRSIVSDLSPAILEMLRQTSDAVAGVGALVDGLTRLGNKAAEFRPEDNPLSMWLADVVLRMQEALRVTSPLMMAFDGLVNAGRNAVGAGAGPRTGGDMGDYLAAQGIDPLMQSYDELIALATGSVAPAVLMVRDALEKQGTAARDTSATISGLNFNTDKALQGWSKTDAALRGEIRALARDMERDGIKVVITSTFRSGNGSSAHDHGRAVDLWFDNFEEAKRWWMANSDKYKIKFPVSDENPFNYAGTTYGTGKHWHVVLAEGAEKAQRAVNGLSAAEREAAKAARDSAREAEQLARQRLTAEDALRRGNAAIDAYLEGLRSEIEQQGMSAEAKVRSRVEEELLAAAKQLTLDATKASAVGNQELADALTQVAQRYRDIIPEAQDLAVELERGTQKADTFGEMWTGTLEEVGRSIQDSLVQGFKDAFAGSLSSAKDFVDRLKDIILNAIANLAAQVAARPILVGINAVLGNMGMSGAAQANGLGGGGGFNLGGITSIFSGNSIGEGINTALVGGFNWAQNAFDLGSGFGANFMSGIGNTANWAFGAGGIGGSLLGNMLFDGDYVGIGSSVGSAAGSAIGAGIAGALAVTGPIGAIAGGLLGGIAGGGFGSLFGSKKTPNYQISVYDGKFGAYDKSGAGLYDVVDELNQTFYQMKEEFAKTSNVGASDAFKVWQNYSNRGTVFSDPNDAVNEARKAAEDLARQMVKAFIGGYMEEVKADLKNDVGGEGGIALDRIIDEAFKAIGDDPSAMQGAVQSIQAAWAELSQTTSALMGTWTSEMLGFTDNFVKNTDRLFFTAQDADMSIQELVGTLDLVTTVARVAGLELGDLGKMGLDAVIGMGEEMIAASGGADKLARGIQIYVDQFVGEAEKEAQRLELATSQIEATLGKGGVSDYATRDDYITAIEDFGNISAKTRGQLLSLAGQFDILYDAAEALEQAQRELTDARNAEIEALEKEEQLKLGSFLDSLKPGLDGALEWERIQKIMDDMGLETVPRTAEQLYNAYIAGELTADQMLELAENSEALAAAFAYLADEEQKFQSFLEWLTPPLDGAEQWQRLNDLFAAWGQDVVPRTAEELYALYEAGVISEQQMRFLPAYLEELGAAFDFVAEEARDAKAQAIEMARSAAEAQIESAQRAHDARMDQLNEERERLSELAGNLRGVVSAIDSLRRSLGYVSDEQAEIDRAATTRELSALAASRRTPTPDEIDRISRGLTGSTPDYATREQEILAESAIAADLRTVGERAEAELDVAERQLERLNDRIEQAQEQHQSLLDSIREASDREIERLEAIDWTLQTQGAQQASNVTPMNAELQTRQTEAQEQTAAQVQELRAENAALSTEMAQTNARILTLLRRWDVDGLPATVDSGDGQTSTTEAYVLGFEAAS